jgi:hypothetical protein
VAAVVAEVALYLATASTGATRGARGATLAGLAAFGYRAAVPVRRWCRLKPEGSRTPKRREGGPVICIRTRVGTTNFGNEETRQDTNIRGPLILIRYLAGELIPGESLADGGTNTMEIFNQTSGSTVAHLETTYTLSAVAPSRSCPIRWRYGRDVDATANPSAVLHVNLA